MTPCSLAVKRNEEFVATFTRAGYVSQQVEVKTQVAGEGAAGFAGNIIAGGIIGMGVDAVTGGALEHTPNPVVVALQPDPARRGRAGCSALIRPANPLTGALRSTVLS